MSVTDTFWDFYSAYLESDEWKEKREYIMKRAALNWKEPIGLGVVEYRFMERARYGESKWTRLGWKGNPMCEKCLEMRASFVHHLTYERVGCERDEDLQAVCLACHRAWHPDKELQP